MNGNERRSSPDVEEWPYRVWIESALGSSGMISQVVCDQAPDTRTGMAPDGPSWNRGRVGRGLSSKGTLRPLILLHDNARQRPVG